MPLEHHENRFAEATRSAPPRTRFPALLLAGAFALLGACAAAGDGEDREAAALILPPLKPGVSLELARHRAATLRDVAYELTLDVRDSTRAPGSVAITVSRHPGAGDLVLDFRGLALGAVRVDGQPAPDAAWRQDHVVIPAAYFSADTPPAGAGTSGTPNG